MKLSDLSKNSLAIIKSNDIKDPNLKRHLLEMGFVVGTQIKVIRYSKDKQIITLRLRDYEISLSKDILNDIMVSL